jgi:hypothetical protein
LDRKYKLHAGKETAFYLIYNDEVSPSARAAALASYEGGENVTWERIYDADSTVWKIMVKDAATDGFGLKLGAVLEDGSGGLGAGSLAERERRGLRASRLGARGQNKQRAL